MGQSSSEIHATKVQSHLTSNSQSGATRTCRHTKPILQGKHHRFSVDLSILRQIHCQERSWITSSLLKRMDLLTMNYWTCKDSWMIEDRIRARSCKEVTRRTTCRLQKSQVAVTPVTSIKVSFSFISFFRLCVLNLFIDVLNKHAAVYQLSGNNKSAERSKHPHEPSSPASVQLGNLKQRG